MLNNVFLKCRPHRLTQIYLQLTNRSNVVIMKHLYYDYVLNLKTNLETIIQIIIIVNHIHLTIDCTRRKIMLQMKRNIVITIKIL